MYSIDLHAHTTASDGTFTPTELVNHAYEVGLTALAVTDHDTIDGLEEAMQVAKTVGLELIPGIELAISYPSGRFHMLGYFIDPDNEQLSSRLTRLKVNRAARNERMAERMQELGIPITLEEIIAESGGGQVGRPHMAMAMLKKGLVGSMQEAFDKYLADGAIAHLPKDKITLEEGLDLIHGAGGLASLAHPTSLKLDDAALAPELVRLRTAGLDGLECYYSQHTVERTEALLAMAQEAGLLPTGGSDFHGAAKPHVFLGRVFGDRPAPTSVLDALKARSKAN
jgi:predicted metal-dependent phosphoesterase TrpH